MLTGGQVADCTAGATLLNEMPPARILHGDKGYDSNAIRRQVEAGGTMPNIPPKANRRWKNCFSPVLYRGRNAIERMFCRLKVRIPTEFAHSFRFDFAHLFRFEAAHHSEMNPPSVPI